jgi:hypothetical protein
MVGIPRLGVLLGAVGLAVAAGPVARVPIAATAAAPAIGFEVPRLTDPIHTYGEPNIGIEPANNTMVTQPSDQTTGRVYVSGPTGTGTQRSIWQGSIDGGHTFRNISRTVPGGLPGCDTITVVCGPLAGPGGGDTEVAFDSNNKQYFADLYALACQHTATRVRNVDGSETVAENDALGGCPVPGSDRQWIVVKDSNLATGPFAPSARPRVASAPIVYMESNTVVQCNGNGGGGWFKSSDGLTYSGAQVDGQAGFPLVQTYCPFGADGYPSIDQTTGKVFQANYSSVMVNGTAKAAIQLNIGTPNDAAGNLCFLDHPAGACGDNAGPGPITIAVNNPALNDVVDDRGDAANFVVSSIDSGRNLWVAWVNRAANPALAQTWVAVAPPGPNNTWSTWSTPIKVSSGASHVSIFPWIQAGSAGRADVAWYGDAVTADPSDGSAHHSWNVFMSQVVFPKNANLTSAAPSVTQVKVTPHPMDLQDACLSGTACVTNQPPGNRNLADFFQIRTDSTGAAMIVYVDLGNLYCQPGFCDALSGFGFDHKGSELVTIARQSSGPGIKDDGTGNAVLVTGPSNAPVSGLADASGDARWNLFGGTNVPEMDIIHHSLASSGQTLSVQMTTAGDPRNSSGPLGAVNCLSPTCNTEYVTRWQMGSKLYFAMYESGGTTPGFYAGEIQTIDDCSVSACDPHTITYPEGTTETGNIECPPTPSAALPCRITLSVNLADVGNPTNSSLLEEVAGYSFVATVPQSAMTQATERNDNGATEIDGVCCYNFQAAGITAPPPGGGGTTTGSGPTQLPNTAAFASATPAAVALLGVGALGAGLAARRRRRKTA